jgi:hypothetical protein
MWNATRAVALLLAQDAGADPSGAEANRPGIKAHERVLLRRLFNMLFGGIVAVILGLVLITIGDQNELMVDIGLLLLIGGVLVALYGVLSPLRAVAFSPRPAARPKVSIPTEPILSLPADPVTQAVPSITEMTTRSLAGAEDSEFVHRGQEGSDQSIRREGR